MPRQTENVPHPIEINQSILLGCQIGAIQGMALLNKTCGSFLKSCCVQNDNDDDAEIVINQGRNVTTWQSSMASLFANPFSRRSNQQVNNFPYAPQPRTLVLDQRQGRNNQRNRNGSVAPRPNLHADRSPSSSP